MGFINWESESYPAANDFIVVPIFALFFTSVRLFLDNYVFEKIARRLILGKKSTLADVRIHANQKKIGKFKESAWKCVYFLSAELFALFASYNEPWFTDTKYFWVGPGDQIWPDQKLKLKLKGLYMYGAGFYTYSIFALVFWETRRSDFLISMSHHVITVLLLVLSYIFRFARVGSIVLALHDATDVYLEIAKMSRYSGYELISSIFFVTFVIVWTILRIMCYLFWILRSRSWGSYNHFESLGDTIFFGTCVLIYSIHFYSVLLCSIYIGGS